MSIKSLDHVSIRTLDVEATRQFYVDTLDLEVGPRPEFPFPGLWLYKDDKAIVHIVGVDPDDPSGLLEYLGGRVDVTDETGSFDHVAFVCQDYEGTKAHIEKQDIQCRAREIPSMNLNQLFVTDPNGVVVELNFHMS